MKKNQMMEPGKIMFLVRKSDSQNPSITNTEQAEHGEVGQNKSYI